MYDVTAHPDYKKFVQAAADDPAIWLLFGDWLDKHDEPQRAALAWNMPAFLAITSRLQLNAQSTAAAIAVPLRVASDSFRVFARESGLATPQRLRRNAKRLGSL